MAARVGTGATGTSDAASASVAAGALSTTTGNAITVLFKWEVVGVTLSSVTDTAGNSYTIDQQLAHSTGGEPHGAIAYCLNATGNAANVVTGNFSNATATFRRIFVEEWSGLGTAGIDGTSTNNSGAGLPYTTGNIVTTTSGLVVSVVADFSALTSPSATGTPTFTLGNTLTDCFVIYLISGSAQTVSPAASVVSGNTQWVMLATAFKNGAVGGSTPSIAVMGRCVYVLP
jgi:hypothetical protein